MLQIRQWWSQDTTKQDTASRHNKRARGFHTAQGVMPKAAMTRSSPQTLWQGIKSVSICCNVRIPLVGMSTHTIGQPKYLFIA